MLKVLRKRIGIIGYGNMGSAIAERIKARYRVFVFDKDTSRVNGLKDINVSDSIDQLIATVDIIILAIKPQDFKELLREIKDKVRKKLIISIAAGVGTSYIEKMIGKIRVIRVMPNLPARVGRGLSYLCKGQYATDKDLLFAVKLFKSLGVARRLLDENRMDAVTAFSGSCPGFFYDLIEGKNPEEVKTIAHTFATSMTASAEIEGFQHLEAKEMAEYTVDGSIAFLNKTGLSPEEARQQVVSKGGTTEAGLSELKGDIGNLNKAVGAAKRRAEELLKILSEE